MPYGWVWLDEKVLVLMTRERKSVGRTLMVPSHVAIIMDGNGRWAEKRGLPRIEGHRAGINNVRPVTTALKVRGVKYLTIYAFSTENWNRPRHEVDGLLHFLSEALMNDVGEYDDDGVRVRHLGKLDRLPENVQRDITRVVDHTKRNNRITLNVAFDYGGRDEIVNAIRHLIADGVSPEAVEEDLLARYLYTVELPDPDLLIRTGGEMRLSNFLTWQSAYSELYFTDTFWPDFDEHEVTKALTAYGKRERRFGKLSCQQHEPRGVTAG